MLFFGIESFSGPTLKKMNKGTDILKSIHILKEARRLGLEITIGIINNFPGEPSIDYKTTLKYLQLTRHLYDAVHELDLILFYDSYIFYHPEQFGISRISHSEVESALYPTPFINKSFQSFACRYSSKSRRKEPYQSKIHSCSRSTPILTCTLKNNKAVLEDSRYNYSVRFLLRSPEKKMLIFCDYTRALYEIDREFNNVYTKGTIRTAIKSLIKKGLIISSKSGYLSLVILKTQ